jgi:hypothetical protein
MEKEMISENRLKFGLVASILIAVAFLAAYWVTVKLENTTFPPRPFPSGNYVPGDLEFFYFVSTIISTINIAMLIMLLVTYINIYMKTRSAFTIGLVIFAAAFLMKDLSASPFVTGLFSFRAFGLGPFVFLPGLFELAALSVLLYLSIKY